MKDQQRRNCKQPTHHSSHSRSHFSRQNPCYSVFQQVHNRLPNIFQKQFQNWKPLRICLVCVCTAVCGWFSIRFKNGNLTKKNSIPFRSNSKAWTIYLKEVFIAKWTKMTLKTNRNEWNQKKKWLKSRLKKH